MSESEALFFFKGSDATFIDMQGNTTTVTGTELVKVPSGAEGYLLFSWKDFVDGWHDSKPLDLTKTSLDCIGFRIDDGMVSVSIKRTVEIGHVFLYGKNLRNAPGTINMTPNAATTTTTTKSEGTTTTMNPDTSDNKTTSATATSTVAENPDASTSGESTDTENPSDDSSLAAPDSSTVSEITDPSSSSKPANTDNSQNTKKPSVLVPILIIAIILVLAGGAIAVIVMLKKKKGQNG